MSNELVKNGDFSDGNKKFESDYTHVNGAPGSDGNVTPSYDIDTSPALAANSFSDWADFGDHTSGSGKMMICNGDVGAAWSENITLKAGHAYTFDLWARDIDSNSNGAPPQLQFSVAGQAIGTVLTLSGNASAGWQELHVSYVASATTTGVSIQDLTAGFPYNDFALDDISIRNHGVPAQAHPDGLAGHLDPHPAFADAHLPAHPAIA